MTGATGAFGSTGAAGATGATGAAGSVWRNGSGAPSASSGVNGDYYLNTANGDVYLRSSGSYSTTGNIKGATGATGAAGTSVLNWLGSWSNATAYAVNDAVTYNNGSYRASAASTGLSPDTNPDSWTVIAAAGSTSSGQIAGGGLLSSSYAGILYSFKNTDTSTTNAVGVQALLGSPTVSYAPIPTSSGIPSTYKMGLLAASSGGNVGVYANNTGSGGVAVWGSNTSTGITNWNAGVLGTSAAGIGRGVAGVASGTVGAFGVFGQATGASGNNNGVYGMVPATGSSTGAGVRGENLNTSGGIGVYASTAASGGRSIFANGSVYIENQGTATSATDILLCRATGGGFCGFNSSGQSFNASDRNVKENFEPISNSEILEKLVAMPITKWTFKQSDDSVKYVGPMAQDFHAAFGLGGSNDRVIHATNAQGVTMAALQGLNTKVEDKTKTLEARLNELEVRVVILENSLTWSQKIATGNLGIGMSLIGVPVLGYRLIRRRRS